MGAAALEDGSFTAKDVCMRAETAMANGKTEHDVVVTRRASAILRRNQPCAIVGANQPERNPCGHPSVMDRLLRVRVGEVPDITCPLWDVAARCVSVCRS